MDNWASNLRIAPAPPVMEHWIFPNLKVMTFQVTILLMAYFLLQLPIDFWNNNVYAVRPDQVIVLKFFDIDDTGRLVRTASCQGGQLCTDSRALLRHIIFIIPSCQPGVILIRRRLIC